MAREHERDDEALLEELARLLERLRWSRYQQVLEKAQTPAGSLVEDFVDLLSRQLLFEENILIPPLKDPSAPGAEQKLESLKVEHGKLRGFAMDLVRWVGQGELDRTADTGRLFMAALLDHMKRESAVTRQILLKLPPPGAVHLKKKPGFEKPSAP